MRLSLDGRARRWLRSLPRVNVYNAAEVALLVLLAVQCARLVWTVVTPVGPLGDWRLADRTAGAVANRAELFRGFDPFFRLAGGGQGAAVVTSLQLKLFGTRIDEVNGRGSAIIAGPDGIQNSIAVGDEIMPGVILKGVAFDSVTIDRGGTIEQLFIDQSVPAPEAATVAPALSLDGSQPPAAAPPGGRTISAAQLRGGIGFVPRTDGGRVTGLILRPNGDGAAFRGVGFAEGDILVAVNGQQITSASDAERMIAQATPGANVTASVERGANVIPIVLSIAR
jgi:general secretion pathway protein C